VNVPFPAVFWIAILLEVLERLAFYGTYVNLAVYLTDTAGLSDTGSGLLLGWFSATRAWVPVATGALSDRIGFRKALLVAFTLYVGAYAALAALPAPITASAAVLGIGVAGAFLKPVIPAAVRRYSPPARAPLGFSIFYASVNAGSVLGKVGTKIVRTAIGLRASIVNSVLASILALAITVLVFAEPKGAAPGEGRMDQGARLNGAPDDGGPTAPPAPRSGFLASLREAGKNPRFVVFLLVVSGYYLLLEQFYQTFPVYITRRLGEGAPRELITLVNPAAIAIFQLAVAKVTRKLAPLVSMTLGIAIGSVSMLLMGLFPSVLGASVSFFVFALAEMTYSPRYYEYVSSFAPPGREGLYMGLAFVPFGVGGLAGGVLSGRLIARYLPKGGPLDPLVVWATYAAIGVACAALVGLFGVWAARARTRDRAGASAPAR
jgi:dipeptide/tripeptide permease